MEDALAAPAPRRLARVGAWLASRFPFLWRTRTPLWIGLAIVPMAFTITNATITLDFRPDALQDYATVHSSFIYWWTVTTAVMFACIVDVVLRADAIESPRNALRFFAAVSISLGAIAIPQYVMIVSVLGNIAALETDASMASLLETHRTHKFWQCVDEATVQPIIDANRAAIARDLQRYGVDTDFTFVYSPRQCEGSLTAARDLRTILPGSTNGDTVPSLLQLFEDRVRNVEAARDYVKGEVGLYSFVPMANASFVFLTTFIGATIATAFPATRRLRVRLVGERLRVRMPRLMRIAWPWSLDVRFASRYPTIWASRMYHVGRWLLVTGSVLYLVARIIDSRTGFDTWIATCAALGIGGLAILLGTQERVRYLSTRLSTEIGMFACQALVIVVGTHLLSGVLTHEWFFGDEFFLITVFFAFALAGTLQAVRCGSWRTAFGGLVAGPVFVMWTSSALSDTLTSTDTMIVLAGTYAVLAVLTLKFGARLETWPTIRRLSIASVLTVAPLPGFIVANALSEHESTWWFVPAMTLTAAACSIAVLVVTDYDRHAVAQ